MQKEVPGIGTLGPCNRTRTKTSMRCCNRVQRKRRWTTDARGESKVGNNLEFWFSGYRGAVMEVCTLKLDELVRWRVIDGGAKDWIGTEVEFKIFRDDAKTFLHFRHSKWHEDAKSFPHCSLGWAIFLLSLKEFVETAKAVRTLTTCRSMAGLMYQKSKEMKR